MSKLIVLYNNIEEKILNSLESNGLKHRPKSSCGLWLGILVGVNAGLIILKEDNSYSETCLLVGVTGFGLVISSLCLYLTLSINKIPVKDYQVIYFLPAIVTSILYLLFANKGLLASVIWGLSTGSLGTWGVIQLISFFPNCFTLGEAMAVMHSCILFLLSTVTNLLLRYHLPPIHYNDIATVLIQISILYVSCICVLCRYIPYLRSTKYFYSTIVGIFSLFYSLIYTVLDRDPISWLVVFVFGSLDRVLMIVYWAMCLSCGVLTVVYQILKNTASTTVTRKIFHLLAVLVYIPGLLYDQTLLYLASGLIFSLFLLFEVIRFFKIPPLGTFFQQGFLVFADEKDYLISLTPLYLLCGLSFPLWMPTHHSTLFPLLSGVLAIGVGDSAASFVGSKWGKHKWYGSNKSLEGTVACISSQIIFLCSLAYFGQITTSDISLKCLFAVLAVSFTEAVTDQVDNLLLPLLMYVLLT